MAVPSPPAVAGTSLPAVPGLGGTANNWAHAAAVLHQCFAADTAMASVGQPIMIYKVDAAAIHCTHYVGNMDAINSINCAILEATKLIGKPSA
jgi:hypothetical protein